MNTLVYRIYQTAPDEIAVAETGSTAVDLAKAWGCARTHREEMDREIAANGDDSFMLSERDGKAIDPEAQIRLKSEPVSLPRLSVLCLACQRP